MIIYSFLASHRDSYMQSIDDRATPHHQKNWAAARQVTQTEQVVDPQAMRAKVEADIAFLNSKVEALRKQPKVNQLLMDNYLSMLKSRTAVLNWLLDGSEKNQHGLVKQSA
jgi:hypothetical protein